MSQVNDLVHEIPEIDDNPIAARLPMAPLGAAACDAAMTRNLNDSPFERERSTEVRLMKPLRLRSYKHTALMTPKGILFKHHFFQCDHLIDAKYAQRALNGNYRMEIRCSPNDCDEVLFFDSALQRWIMAKNMDARLRGKGYSFKEAWQCLAVAKLAVLQAVANRVVQRDATAPALDQRIAQAKQEAKQPPAAPKSRTAIRDNRTAALHQERQGNSWTRHAAPAHTADGDGNARAATPPPCRVFKRSENARVVS